MNKTITKLKNSFFASCPVGFENCLNDELSTLNITDTFIARGGVHFKCYPQNAIKFLLTTKIASRVYKALFKFDIKNEEDLYRRCLEIKWRSIFNLEQTFKIETIQGKSPNGKKRSAFKSSVFLSQRVKDGIVDTFREKLNKRPDVDTKSPDASFVVRVTPHDNEFSSKEEVTILLDLCGAPLSNRGYRKNSFVAPLRENLAAGIIALSNFNETNIFIDLMSGSGTLAIEAALYKSKMPGSYLFLQDYFEFGDELDFNFLNLNFYTKDQYLQDDFKKIISELKEQMAKSYKSLEKISIIANEIDPKNISNLKENIKNACLDKFINIKNEDATTFSIDIKNATLVANPPYGERIGNKDELEKTYYDLGENLKNNFKENTAYIFTGNIPLIKKISLQTSKKIILFNGNIESRLVEYKLY
ncbi:MAG: THUMP domain-containing protein [Bacteriovoracaceae bacterium]|jgi:23S rRNA G2445 N2-methylase RlmL|nr:THUMP domain-containing protein [Bacteriovoracaceae bacterium]